MLTRCARLSVRRAALLTAFSLAGAGSLLGQTPIAKPDPAEKKKMHWRKYINKELGFSLLYPDSYKPSDFDGVCKDNEYRRYLLCLRRQDDPDASILVTLIVAGPFRLHSLNKGDALPDRKLIRGKAFYCGMGGSMGVGFDDSCLYDLKGKTLEFAFSPNETINTPHPENALAYKVLNTFRLR